MVQFSLPGQESGFLAPPPAALAAALENELLARQNDERKKNRQQTHSPSSTPPSPNTDAGSDEAEEKQKRDAAEKIDDLAVSDRSQSPSEVEARIHTRSSNASKIPTPWFPRGRAWKTYFMQEVAGDKYLELQLLVMTMATGILDAMTYSTFSVFTSKQTGNTLFLALYALQTNALAPGIECNVGVSMGTFILGAIFFGHIGNISQQRRRIWLLISNLFQALLILAAAAIRYWAAEGSDPKIGTVPRAILALLSLAESGQIATALNVGLPELNTTMITGALIQLCTDRQFLKFQNPKRNRRLLFLASMMAGCFMGAAMVQHASKSAALLLVGAMKTGLVLSFLLNRGWVVKGSPGPPDVVVEKGSNTGGKMDGAVTPVSRILWGD